MPAEARVIAATGVGDEIAARARVDAALDGDGVSYLLFEHLSSAYAIGIVNAASARHLPAIATTHLPTRTYSAAEIIDELAKLEDCGAAIVKIAYKAVTAGDVAVGLEALERSRERVRVPVSITPMGTRWGRIAAAAAGSCLVFAPWRATPDRQSASEMLQLLEALR
jgi:3-dehydroquinate dehydratase